MMIVVFLPLVLWFGFGFYGMLANIERVPRVWGERSSGDWVQDAATLLLGPLGICFVLATGGRIKFWSKAQ